MIRQPVKNGLLATMLHTVQLVGVEIMAPIKPHVEELIRTTVRQTLLQLGLDVSDNESVIELQKDFAYVRSWRQSVEEVKKKGLLTLMGIVLAGAAGIFWTALKGTLH